MAVGDGGDLSLREDLPGERDDGIPASAARRVAWREALAVAGIAGLLYGLTLSAVPALTHDSPGYLLSIEAGGRELFHPHHLAYNALARGWLDVLSAVGIGADPLRLVELLNAILGACATALVWTLLRLRARVARHLAAAGTAGAGLSYGFWFYSVSVEVYMLPLVFLLGAFLVLSADELSFRAMVVLGALTGLAVIAHQANVLFAVVVLAVVARHVDRAAVLRRLSVYGAAATGVVAAAYGAVLAFAIRPGSVGDAADWFTRYAHTGGYWHVAPSAPVEAAFGFGRALVGGQFAYRLDPVRDRVASMFPGRSLVDEAYLVRGTSPALALVLVAMTVVGIGALLAAVVVGLRRRRSLTAHARRVLGPLVIWLATYSALFVVWQPTNPEFWIPQATVLWMIAAVLASPSRTTAATGQADGRPVRRLLVTAAAAVGVANLIGTILPATDRSNDIYFVRYSALGQVVDAGDLVVVDHPHLGVGYVDRFTAADAVVVSRYARGVPLDDQGEVPPLGDVVSRLERALDGGDRIAIDAQLIEQPTVAAADRAGRELALRFGNRWRHVTVSGALGWYVVEP